MQLKSLVIASAMLLSLACSKSNNSNSSTSSYFDVSKPLTSTPHATVSNHTILLDVTKCVGPIVRYTWSRYDTAVVNHPVTFSTSTSWKSSDSPTPLVVQAQVNNPAAYAFQLIVYDKDNNQNSQFFTVIVSQ